VIWLRNRGCRYHAYEEGTTSLCGRARTTGTSSPERTPDSSRCVYCVTVIKQAQALEVSR